MGGWAFGTGAISGACASPAGGRGWCLWTAAARLPGPGAAGLPAGAPASCGSRTAWAPARPAPAFGEAASRPCMHLQVSHPYRRRMHKSLLSWVCIEDVHVFLLVFGTPTARTGGGSCSGALAGWEQQRLLLDYYLSVTMATHAKHAGPPCAHSSAVSLDIGTKDSRLVWWQILRLAHKQPI